MTNDEREELEKQAQQKLADARKLINEAGDLAKKGQFFLHFGEIGDFIPKSLLNRESYREIATEEAKQQGRIDSYEKYDHQRSADGTPIPYGSVAREQWVKSENPSFFIVSPMQVTPWADLTEDEQDDLIEQLMDDRYEDNGVPCDFREYCGAEDADRWWHPSRC